MDVNPTKEKKLTNMRQSSGDVLVPLIPHRMLSLEQALEFCRDDECVEVTPATVRIRKVLLPAQERARARGSRSAQPSKPGQLSTARSSCDLVIVDRPGTFFLRASA